MAETSVYQRFLRKELPKFFQLKPSNRSWHIPILAGLAVGIPLLTGYFFNDVRTALTASLAGLVILYIPTKGNIMEIMVSMFVSCFGMIIAHSLGFILSFNSIAAPIGFGVFSMIAYYVSRYFNLKPPGSFFFIMIASMAIGLPHEFKDIPKSIGIFTIGTLNAVVLTFLYSIIFLRKKSELEAPSTFTVNHHVNLAESAIIGIFMMLSIFIGKIFKLDYPYWIPISCLAVLQGVNSYHIWKRGLHRIIGTLTGLFIAWAIFSYVKNPLYICICIIALQIIVELLIVRHYALAVVFLTPMGILLAETGSPQSLDPDHLLKMRFIEILIGSVLGGIGGWFLHNEQLRSRLKKFENRTDMHQK